MPPKFYLFMGLKMKIKIGAICIIIAVLMFMPLMGIKLLGGNEWSGSISNAQQTNTETIRGMWVASAYNTDFPSKAGLTSEQQIKELDDILNNAQYMGMNAIFFQVRPTGDALYKSNIFPTSTFLTGQQGKPNDKNFDPLAYLITEGHKKGIQIHAWINPLRLSMGTTAKPDSDIKKLAATNQAKKIAYAAVQAQNGQLYLDPGYPEAVKLITDGVAEIVKNYDVDGIHFDDYFYPSKVTSKDKKGRTVVLDFNDNASYSKYKGSFSNKEDWRRNNINTLVKSTYDTIKAIKPDVQFGISPFGVWAGKDKSPEGSDTMVGGTSTYYDHYADSKKWVKEGFIDYIAPQIYWNIGFEKADYAKLVSWWKDVCAGTKTKLYIGQAAYKINDPSQANEWLDPLQIPKQIALNRSTKAVSGSIFYGYPTLRDNVLGIKDKLRGIFVLGNDPSGAVPEDRQLIIAQPNNGYKTSYSNISILGSCDPKQPLYLNGNVINTSQDGYFTQYVSLNPGENSLVFKHKGKETVLKVTYNKGSSKPYEMTTPGFKPYTFSPTQSMTMKSGRTIDFSCVAPTDAKVWVQIGNYSVSLKQQESVTSASGSAIGTSKYSGNFTFPDVPGNAKVTNLGKPEYFMEYKGQRISNKMSYTLTSESNKYIKYAVVSVSGLEGVTRSGPSTDFGRLTPLINGAADYIVGQQNGFYLLRSGVWINSNDVKVVTGKTLANSKISTVKIDSISGYTSISYKMPVNPVFNVVKAGGSLVLTIYNTSGAEASKQGLSSSAFTTMDSKQVNGGIQYTFRLKTPDSYYGYYVEYKNGTFIFNVKNAPQITKTGSKPLTGLKVLLDAGHGGSEWGALGPLSTNGLVEKQINLSITLSAKNYLEKLGATVILTRSTDKTVSLTDRANMIRMQKPDIAVSIHNNSMDTSSDYSKYAGLMVLYSKDSSTVHSDFIKNALIGDLKRTDKGSKWQSLSVCTVTQSPAILIEGGFLSNPSEYEWLANYNNQVAIGNSIGKAIENWAYKNAR